MELIIIGFLFLVGVGVFVAWLSGLKEQKRVEELIRNTNPEPVSVPPRDMTREKSTRIEGFRTRMKQFKNTLIGVGRTGY